MSGTVAAAGERVSPAIGPHVSEPELTISGLRKRFGDGPVVLNGVDISVVPGEAVALIGANGAGKSTVMRCCMRLIEPDEGSILIHGQEMAKLSRDGLRKARARVGFVFQKHNLVPRLSTLSNVLHGAQGRFAGPRAWLHGLAPRELREEALHCLELVGLADFAARRVDRLSGGQSQRVAIARALMQRPRLILADEPVASLDPNAGEEVMELFLGLMRSEGLTLFYSSHNLDHALTYSDRVVALNDGRIALAAPRNELNVEMLRGIYG